MTNSSTFIAACALAFAFAPSVHAQTYDASTSNRVDPRMAATYAGRSATTPRVATQQNTPYIGSPERYLCGLDLATECSQ